MSQRREPENTENLRLVFATPSTNVFCGHFAFFSANAFSVQVQFIHFGL